MPPAGAVGRPRRGPLDLEAVQLQQWQGGPGPDEREHDPQDGGRDLRRGQQRLRPEVHQASAAHRRSQGEPEIFEIYRKFQNYLPNFDAKDHPIDRCRSMRQFPHYASSVRHPRVRAPDERGPPRRLRLRRRAGPHRHGEIQASPIMLQNLAISKHKYATLV